MKTFFKSIIFLILFNGCSDADKPINDLKQMSIKANVRILKEYSYEAINKFGEITKGERKRKLGEYDFVIFFNNIGQITEKNLYTEGGQIYENKTYYYNEKGKKSRELLKNELGLECPIEFSYDSNGLLIEERTYSAAIMLSDHTISNGKNYEKTCLLYDQRQKVIEENNYDSDGRLSSRIMFQYNEQGNITEKSVYSPDGTLAKKVLYTYNKSNIIDSKSIYGFNGVLMLKSNYNSEKFGNLIAETIYQSNGQIVAKLTYDYVYDDQNNWIVKTENKNGIPAYIIERELDYYR